MGSTKLRVQSLPCTIHSNSSTDVEQYFNSCVREEDGIFYTSFRGRPITGVRFEPPAGYTTALLTKRECMRSVAGSTTSSNSLVLSALPDEVLCWMLDPPAPPGHVLDGLPEPQCTRPVVARAAACAKLLDAINDLDAVDEGPIDSQKQSQPK